jgi:hypothetical protein
VICELVTPEGSKADGLDQKQSGGITAEGLVTEIDRTCRN